MKICVKCQAEKELSEFYNHPSMELGVDSKCKECAKEIARANYAKKSENPEWMESERKRSREKYERLNYKEQQLIWDAEKSWKKHHKYKNLSRKFKTPKGYELHHWNYNEQYLEDVVLMDIKSHKNLHKLLGFNLEKRIFFILETGYFLDTKIKHLQFISSSGFHFKNP